MKGRVFTIRDRMVITDPEDNKVAVLQKKLMAVRAIFQVYFFFHPCGLAVGHMLQDSERRKHFKR